MFTLYNYTSHDIYENIAIDEALFLHGKKNLSQHFLRVWEHPSLAVIIGRSQKIEKEVNVTNCVEKNIPIVRRSSAGGTVLQGPGSLNFVFSFPFSTEVTLKDVRKSFEHFASHIQAILKKHKIPSGYRLLSDITDGQNKKISGNAQSRSFENVMHHGTLISKPIIDDIEKYLIHPTQEPDYREGRSHNEFITSIEEMGFKFNLKDLAQGLKEEFNNVEVQERDNLPQEIMDLAQDLKINKYKKKHWNYEGKRK